MYDSIFDTRSLEYRSARRMTGHAPRETAPRAIFIPLFPDASRVASLRNRVVISLRVLCNLYSSEVIRVCRIIRESVQQSGEY